MRALLLALALLVSGCGAMRFQNAWSSFAERTPEVDMEGRWEGGWHSHWNGHSGGLRCVVTREQEGRYRAWFYSTYARVLFFQYQTELAVTAEAVGTQRFEGEQDLGAAVGGVYHYRGYVAGDEFHAHYRAENGDHGVFAMERVASP
jgi:hypothetical protein